MILTPTSKSQFAAGAAFWATAWAVLREVDSLAKPLHLGRWIQSERIFFWIDHNRILAFLCTELINYARVGTDSPGAVTFALGGSVVNAIVIFLLLPCRKFVGRIVRSLCFWRPATPRHG